jgi:hypothetical protein
VNYFKKFRSLSILHLNTINVDAANVKRPQPNMLNEREFRREADRWMNGARKVVTAVPSVGVFPERNVLSPVPSTTCSSLRETRMNISLGILGMGFRKVPSTRRILSPRRGPRGENFPTWFFFFVTHLKQLLVASNPALHSPRYNSIPGQYSEDLFSRINVPPGYPTDTCSIWGPTSPLGSSGHSGQQGHDRHALRLRLRLDVPSQRSHEPYRSPQLVPSVEPAQRRYVCLFA